MFNATMIKKHLYIPLIAAVGVIVANALLMLLYLSVAQWFGALLCGAANLYTIGCSLFIGYGMIVVHGVIVAIGSTVLLRRRTSMKFWPAATAASIMALVIQTIIVANLNSGSGPLNPIEQVVLSAFEIICATTYLAATLFVLRAKQKPVKIIGFILMAVLIAVIYTGTIFTMKQLAVGVYRQSQVEEVKDLAFKVYEPTYKVDDYQLRLSSSLPSDYTPVGPGYIPNYANDNGLTTPPYFYFTYYALNGRSANDAYNDYTIYEYANYSDYAPTTNCNKTMTSVARLSNPYEDNTPDESQASACELAGHTHSGSEIYYGQFTLKHEEDEPAVVRQFSFTKIGSTIVAVEFSKDFIATNPSVDLKQEAKQIFSSMRELSDQQIKDYAVGRYKVY